jgi:hypothetical protein
MFFNETSGGGHGNKTIAVASFDVIIISDRGNNHY